MPNWRHHYRKSVYPSELFCAVLFEKCQSVLFRFSQFTCAFLNLIVQKLLKSCSGFQYIITDNLGATLLQVVLAFSRDGVAGGAATAVGTGSHSAQAGPTSGRAVRGTAGARASVVCVCVCVSVCVSVCVCVCVSKIHQYGSVSPHRLCHVVAVCVMVWQAAVRCVEGGRVSVCVCVCQCDSR